MNLDRSERFKWIFFFVRWISVALQTTNKSISVAKLNEICERLFDFWHRSVFFFVCCFVVSDTPLKNYLRGNYYVLLDVYFIYVFLWNRITSGFVWIIGLNANDFRFWFLRLQFHLVRLNFVGFLFNLEQIFQFRFQFLDHNKQVCVDYIIIFFISTNEGPTSHLSRDQKQKKNIFFLNRGRESLRRKKHNWIELKLQAIG